MEMIIEKINVAGFHKINLIDICTVGKRIHYIIKVCGDSCGCITYLLEINLILESMNEEEATLQERLKFRELSLKNPRSFLLFDQINRKFGGEIFQLTDNCLKFAFFFFFFFEIEKIKRFLKTIDDFEKLEEQMYVISKTFL